MQPGFPDESNDVEHLDGVGRLERGAGRLDAPKSRTTAIDRVLEERLIDRLGARHYDALRRSEVVFRWNGDELLVLAPSSFLMNVLQTRHRAPLQQIARELRGDSAVVRVQEVAAFPGADPVRPTSRLPEDSSPDLGPVIVPRAPGSASAPVQTPRVVKAAVTSPSEGGLSPVSSRGDSAGPRTTAVRRLARLGDFVAGTAGQVALAAAMQFVSDGAAPGQGLYLFGTTGVGKTHLLEGIADALRRHPDAPQVLLLTAEQLTNQFTSALRSQGLPAFRQRFRQVDVLLVDDVDFLDGKMRIQEEFLHTLQQLESQGRRVVIAADRHPRMLSRTRPELVTRFLSGITCRVEMPDPKTRDEIVVRKARSLGMLLPPEAARVIARARCSSVREIEGALCNLKNLQRAVGGPLTVNLARQVVGMLERDCVRVVRLPDIERVVCETFGVTVEDLRSSRRSRELAEPRMLAMFLARRHTRAAYAEIGRYFGGRNHATVISAEKKIQNALDADAPIRVAVQSWPLSDLVESLEQQLQAS
jgi:chromosomal replication initiator protein